MGTTAQELRREVERRLAARIPAALTPQPHTEAQTVPTGIDAADALILGIPQGALTELVGPAGSGRTSFALSFLAQVTRTGGTAAWIDAHDALDPETAAAAGVALGRMLWVRCRAERFSRSRDPEQIEQALKAADLVLSAGGFGAVVLDLGEAPAAALAHVPPGTWHRLRRAVLGTPAALLVLAPAPCARSCAALALRTAGCEPKWDAPSEPGSVPTLFAGQRFSVERVRRRHGEHRADTEICRTHAVWHRPAAWTR